ncbi:gamma-glutamylcyclotransferase family protein [Roseobacter ponti]|uniref:Gamma-glutamylcyclotransferase n=1 Tax=Roseobacter ponti TaxID=1891787 RepID=A0A858SRP1_9RHOB|nr:gamma-glutamylcyclotransferase [Roseobacter ponti]QJF51345.1 gamma-glutamylcyclotransferase [Roseobacter ponti]
MTDDARSHRRLLVYGTLAPGEINHHLVQALAGTWSRATIRGHLDITGWGASHGCPGFIPDPGGLEVKVHLFTSDDLPAHWQRLDAFEGADYCRSVIVAETESGPCRACIYAFTASPAGRGGSA